MGFDCDVAERNLKKANNNLDKALDFIRDEQLSNGSEIEVNN